LEKIRVQPVVHQPNPYALANIMASAGKRPIVAEADIVCAESGIKLLARGQIISESHYERLLPRRLTQAIESSLVPKTGAETQSLLEAMRYVISRHPGLAHLAYGHEQALSELILEVKLKPTVRLLLTAAMDRDDGMFEHAMVVAVIAAALARRAQLPQASQALLLLGGLVHDLGEMYINPAYLTSKRELSPTEWVQVVSHPQVSARVLIEIAGAPQKLAQIVLSHHERLNGMGYPQRLQGAALGKEAQLLAIAEMIAPIVTKDESGLARAAFALKLIAHEFEPELVGLVSTVAAASPPPPASPDALALAQAQMQELSIQLRNAFNAAQTLAKQPMPRKAAELASRYYALLGTLRTSFNATGVMEFCATVTDAVEPMDAEVGLSVELIPREIRWRMRHLARDIALAKRDLAPQEQAHFAALEIALT
jgi:putative nucleotidyltransferase with HDIG domain